MITDVELADVAHGKVLISGMTPMISFFSLPINTILAYALHNETLSVITAFSSQLPLPTNLVVCALDSLENFDELLIMLPLLLGVSFRLLLPLLESMGLTLPRLLMLIFSKSVDLTFSICCFFS